MIRIIFSAICLLLFSMELPGATPELTLDGPGGQLVWNASGLAVSPKTPSPQVLGAPRPVWAMKLVSLASDKRETFIIEDLGQELQQKKTSAGYELFYPQMKWKDRTFDISLKLVISEKDGVFRITGEIDNRTSDWTVMDMTGPVLNEIQSNPEQFPILLPDGLGLKIATAPNQKKHYGWSKHHENYQRIGTYPSTGCNMQYMVFAGSKGGLYIGSSDATREAKQFVLFYYTGSKNWKASVNHLCCIPPKTRWKRNLVDIYPYTGTWHVAADYYRQEVQSWRSGNLVKPDWVNSSTGMFLVIMNQQNNRHTMWTYDQIGTTMSDAAERQGFDSIGLFGWHKGGHDALYPEMLADPLLGGRDKLIQGIAKARKRGIKVFLYANGQLIDRELKEFWQKEGEKLSIVQPNGKVNNEGWTIYDDSPGHLFGRACLLSDRWYRMMLDLAIDAQKLGANGILYDQVAVNPPQDCWSSEHNHPRPAMTHGVSGSLLMEKVEREMKKIDPDFIVLTEGFNDSAADACAYFHSIGYGVYGTPQLRDITNERDARPATGPFRSFFRYTWPDMALTVRNPLPMIHPLFTNMACVLGLKSEVEIRFPTDVEILRTEALPALELYKNDHLSKSRIYTLSSGLGAFRNITGKYCLDYAQAVARFRLEHQELLLNGRFVDEVGFSRQGKVVAKAFVAGNRIGVLVWNPETTPEMFKIDVPNAKFISAHSPESKQIKDAQVALAPNCIRLLIWEKTL